MMRQQDSSPVWLFDLDNTLHNASAHIFPHINAAMTAYLAEHLKLSLDAAGALRQHYWLRYGATLRGLMRHHDTVPQHFLHHTHQFPNLASMLVYERGLVQTLRRLPGRKVVFSNAPHAYVIEVVKLMGLDAQFDLLFGVEDLGFQPKPHRIAYETVLRRLGVAASRCIMVEDTSANLQTAKRMGMRTVWINPAANAAAPWVDKNLRSVRHLRG